MRIGIYNPYFDSLSGGERYSFVLASHWSKRHTVEIFWDDDLLIHKAQKRLNIDLSRIKSVQNIFRGKNLFKKIYLSRKYDLIFFLSDGSIPTSLARRNILHFQVPFARIPFSALKLSKFQAIVCNSYFTKNHLDQHLAVNARVIYPPVEAIPRNKRAKKNVIISIGRFSSNFQMKKQDVLIEAFRKGCQKNLKGWRLILAGGLLESDIDYLERSKTLAKGLPVTFYPNISHSALVKLYNEASVYWHAAGFGEKKPELMEHFGITTVEAMSAGCIPFAYNAGGQPEIITHGENGYLWNSTEELLHMTSTILERPGIFKKITRNARARAKDFDTAVFCRDFDALLSRICG